MRPLLAVALVFAASLVLIGQEKPVPKDSQRVSLTGCARGRNFTVIRRDTPEPVNSDIAAGRRFRLHGQKRMLEEIAREETMVQVTGLVRKMDIQERGIGIAGGRVRIGGAVPQAPMGGGAVGNVGRDSNYDVPVFDVEGWLQLPDACPSR
jgi:hypothetical protein